jgi:glycerol-3-phosphate acyltransferase PlsY
MRDYLIIAAIAYLCGSIPFGYLLVRLFKGKDIRETGSGNIGATNVARTAPGLGLATLFLDAAKGFAAVLLAMGFFAPYIEARAGSPAYQAASHAAMQHTQLIAAWAALFAVLGHLFPVWLKFQGGKGVATAAGAYLGVSPIGLGLTFLVFAVVFLFSRYVSLASIAAAIAFPALAFAVSFRSLELLLILSAVSVLIIAKHHANIRRLLNGTENRFGKKKAEEQIVAED